MPAGSKIASSSESVSRPALPSRVTSARAAATVEQSPAYHPLLIILVPLAAGMVVDSYASIGFGVWLVGTVVGCGAWWLISRRGRVASAWVCLGAALLSLGAAAHHRAWNLFRSDELGLFATGGSYPVCLEAIALRPARELRRPAYHPLSAGPRLSRSRLEVRVTAIRDGIHWRSASGRSVVLVDGGLPGVRSGDRVRIWGVLSLPEAPANPGAFDFATDARGRRRLSEIRIEHPAAVNVLSAAWRYSPRGLADQVRAYGDRVIWENMSRSRAGLTEALLIGGREELDRDTSDAFMETGTVHLLSISGLHVSFLAGFIWLALRLGVVSRVASQWCVALATVGYAILIDAEPPAVRATIMVLAVCVATLGGRTLRPMNTLAAAALAVLAWNPADLFHVGPQLSFLAMVALLRLSPALWRRRVEDPLDRLIERTRPAPEKALRAVGRAAWQATWLGAVVWLVSVPLVLAHFNLVTPVAVLLSPLLALPVALGLSSGFVMLAFGWLLPPVAAVAAWICDTSLAIVEWSVVAAGNLPGSHFWLPGPSIAWVTGLYLLWGVLTCFPRQRINWSWRVACTAGWCVVGLVPAVWGHRAPDRLVATFLSLGRGTAVVLELPGGETILYDAGRQGSPDGAVRTISGCLWSAGKRRLDAIVVSHPSVDHLNAVPDLARRFGVGGVHVPSTFFDVPADTTDVFREMLAEEGLECRPIWAGDRLAVGGGCTIQVLHPPKDGVLGGDDANSLVLTVEFQGRRILLAGDLAPPGLDDVIAEEPRGFDVVLVPDHGSAAAQPARLAEWARPKFVIISGSNTQGRSAQEECQRLGARVLHTSDAGAVRVVIDNAGVTAAEWSDQGGG